MDVWDSVSQEVVFWGSFLSAAFLRGVSAFVRISAVKKLKIWVVGQFEVTSSDGEGVR